MLRNKARLAGECLSLVALCRKPALFEYALKQHCAIELGPARLVRLRLLMTVTCGLKIGGTSVFPGGVGEEVWREAEAGPE